MALTGINNLMQVKLYESKLSKPSETPKSSKKEKDVMEISEAARKSLEGSKLTQAEKIENRRKIDFAKGAVSFDHITRLFTLPDGSAISADDVAVEIGEDEYSTVQVKDNKLTVEPDKYLRLKDATGKEYIMESGGTTFGTGSFVQKVLSDKRSDYETFKLSNFLSLLSENDKATGIYTLYTDDQVKHMLKQMGFKPGKIEVDIEGVTKGTYFMNHDGDLYSESDLKARIDAINAKNHLKYGAPPGSKWIIDGQEYPMDEYGYFHIPEDVMCIPGEAELVDSYGNPVLLHDPDWDKNMWGSNQ